MKSPWGYSKKEVAKMRKDWRKKGKLKYHVHASKRYPFRFTLGTIKFSTKTKKTAEARMKTLKKKGFYVRIEKL